ncbi:MAG: AMP-binding protein [Candidatus Lambdaproteobacteria bacterium]|nr:AMP-binding protein [Candidatus Lambdaproteobacteria bacterium]
MHQPHTLPQLLLARAGQQPQSICQRHKDRGIWQTYTFGQVQAIVRELALGFAAMGLRRGESVILVGENEPEIFWGEFAVLALGAKCIALYPDLTVDELHYMGEDSEAVFIVAHDQEQVDKALAALERLPKIRAVVYWDEKGLWSYTHPLLHTFAQVRALGREHAQAHPGLFEREVAAGRDDEIAILTYTSGTTGRPKGVVTTHRNLFDSAYRFLDAVPVRPHAEYLSYIPLAWATEQYYGIAIGLLAPLVVNFPEKPEEVLNNIRELAVEVLVFGPRQWESLAATVQARMLDAGRLRQALYRFGVRIGHAVHVARLEGRRPGWLARLLFPLADALVLHPLRDKLGLVRAKVVVSGGSAMAPDVFRLFHAMGVPLRNIYGASEIGLLTAHRGTQYNLETVGHWMTVRPEFGAALEWKIGPDGGLLVRGGSGFNGYYNKAEKSAEKIKDGWFDTGDAVSVTESNELVFLERVDDMRTLASNEKYPPQFIETRLRFSPFIKDVMTVGDRRHPFVTALVNIDPEVVGRWAEERRIGFSTYQDLSQNAEVRAMIQREIARINDLLPPHARVVRFANFPKELDPDEGELTRTRKLRREFLEARYRPLIDGLYGGERHVDAVIPVTYQDGRKGELRARVIINDLAPAPVEAGAPGAGGAARAARLQVQEVAP